MIMIRGQGNILTKNNGWANGHKFNVHLTFKMGNIILSVPLHVDYQL